MSKIRGRQSKQKFNPFLAVLLVAVAVIGAFTTLEATGKTDLGLGRLMGWREVQAGPPANMTAILIPTLALKPGDVLAPEHVWNREKGRLNTGYMSKRDVEAQHFVSDFPSIRNRVLARFKPPGEPFTPSDFLPKDAQPGLIGLVPEGMRLVFLDQERVTGLSLLKFKDRFDLSMTLPVDEDLAKAAKETLEARGRVTPQEMMRLARTKPPEERRLLAQYGMVIKQGITEGKKKLVAVALHPDDEKPTQDAIHGKTELDCIARRTLKEGDPPRIEQAPYDPAASFDWVTEGVAEVEVVQGRVSEVDTTRVAGSPE